MMKQFDYYTPMTDPNRYKYDEEDTILKELQDYISGTYNAHYSVGDDKIQTLDLIEACGDGEAFCRSNILKYASRYDKKGTARRDIMKIMHYAVLLMHFNDKNAKRETYPSVKLKPSNTMKLSDRTINLLKNFSSINQSILFKEGNSLRTISVMKNILAEANIAEDIPRDFGIYDLNQFLNGLNLHQNAELDFQNDGYVVIKEGRSRSKYFFADPNVIVTPPEKSISLPTEDVCFNS